MSEPTNEEIADVLDGAADVLLRDGWGRHRFNADSTKPHCTAGAVHLVCDAHLGDEHYSLFEQACLTLERHLGLREYGLPWWNDHDATEDMAHDALRSTAKALREVPS